MCLGFPGNRSPTAENMKTRRWLCCDRWMRALHLYTGLFLVPWMTVYALSAFCLVAGILLFATLAVLLCR